MPDKRQTANLIPSSTKRAGFIAALAILGIIFHLFLRFGLHLNGSLGLRKWVDLPLLAILLLGGVPLVWELIRKALAFEFGSDLLAGISIITAIILEEYLAGALVVLMLSGGETLEAYAVARASNALAALAKRMPLNAHRKEGTAIVDVPLDTIDVGELLVVFPHETCPVDGTVVEGQSTMDESYLTGEPFLMAKAPGSQVLSGAVNGVSALTIRADRRAEDSRYAKIMNVMRDSEQRRPQLRRLGDQLGALYTPLAVAIAVAAWIMSGDVHRFLAVVVVATPCPLLIAIPVAIIGSISLAAGRGIIIRDPAILERLDTCQTAIFDKTGTLTHGKPTLTAILPAESGNEKRLLQLVASLEQYSKHPLAPAILSAARKDGIAFMDAERVSELPGAGLVGELDGTKVLVTSRKKWLARESGDALKFPPVSSGLECVVVINDRYAGTFQFRDEPRPEGASFIGHLGPRHHFKKLMLVSGDRESEVRYLADRVGINIVLASQSPEQKLEIVREETKRAPTVFLGDGINDAPAMTTATAGLAFGQNSDVTAEAAGAVIMESSLAKVDELLHISRRMRSIALQSALGGIALSLVGMGAAALGYLPPVAGAVSQELIDVVAVVNALRAAWPPRQMTDYADGSEA